MNLDQAIETYLNLSASQQISVLAEYAFRLTIAARGTYIPGTEDIADPRRLRLLNEVQHRVTGHIGNLLKANMKRYPDDILVRIAVADGDNELVAQFATALHAFRTDSQPQ